MQKVVLVTNQPMTNRLKKFDRYLAIHLGLSEYITVFAPLHLPVQACRIIAAEKPYFTAVIFSKEQNPDVTRFMNAVGATVEIPEDCMIQLFLTVELERKQSRLRTVAVEGEDLPQLGERFQVFEIPISYLLADEPDGVLYDMLSRGEIIDKGN